MPSLTLSLVGGADVVNGYGQYDRITVGGTWVAGETWQLQLTPQGLTGIILGAGSFISYKPTFCFTFNNRVFLATGTQFAFSATNDPTGWQYTQDVGSGSIDSSQRY